VCAAPFGVLFAAFVLDAFVDVGSLQLAPVRQYLFETYEEEYTFDELRIARLFLSGEDKMAIEN
jgi:hypothetical protein